MMRGFMYYRISETKVAHELIDGEVIIIHFDVGNYYSLKGAAAQLWDLIAKGVSREQACAAFGMLTLEQQNEIGTFFDYLVSENLVVTSETAPEGLVSAQPSNGKELIYEVAKI